MVQGNEGLDLKHMVYGKDALIWIFGAVTANLLKAISANTDHPATAM